MVYKTPFEYSTKRYVPNYTFEKKKERRPYMRSIKKNTTRKAIKEFQLQGV